MTTETVGHWRLTGPIRDMMAPSWRRGRSLLGIQATSRPSPPKPWCHGSRTTPGAPFHRDSHTYGDARAESISGRGGDGSQLEAVDAGVRALGALGDADVDQPSLLRQSSKRLGCERRATGAIAVAEEGLGEGLGIDLAVAKPLGGGPEVVGNQGEPAPRRNSAAQCGSKMCRTSAAL